MRDALAQLARADREVALAARMEYDRWAREAERQRQEAERWQRRVDLAERHQQFDLATEAAQRARQHAGLALAAEQRSAVRTDTIGRGLNNGQGGTDTVRWAGVEEREGSER